MKDRFKHDRSHPFRTRRFNQDGPMAQMENFRGQWQALPAKREIYPDLGAEPNRCTMLVEGTALGAIAAILREFSSR
jgi:hypothetical protein